ncbi:MAG: glycine cleavage system aminomethyltransferase GcvT [Xanthomonadales bacterium]|nr:glycine cleavage system aminomethyltransferase GcvT [Xanthomonadales bacterium]
MPQKTPLYQAHVDAGARMVDFGGWDMPINYGSQIEEHHQVRRDAGMFDVSHMTVVDLHGARCRAFLSYLLANDVAKLKIPGKALYSCMLNDEGGVIDDLITYFIDEENFRLVVNASTREKDLAWVNKQAPEYGVAVAERPELAMIAVQGPAAREALASLARAEDREAIMALSPFSSGSFGDWFVARTGYTGEDGFELTLPGEHADGLWRRLADAGVKPCGLGARDTLRLEAGMNLYGQDMDETVTPLESGLGWTVAMKDDRAFIGRRALEEQKADGVPRKLVGVVLLGRGVVRPGNTVHTDSGEGVLTSGSFSPTLQRAIGLARVPGDAQSGCQVDVRGKMLDAKIVRPPFARAGNVCSGII